MKQDLRQQDQLELTHYRTLAAELNRAALQQPVLTRMFQQELPGEQQLCVTQLRGGIAFDTVRGNRCQSVIPI